MSIESIGPRGDMDGNGRRGGVWGTGAGPVPHQDNRAQDDGAPLLLTVEAAAQRLSIGRSQLYKLMDSRRLLSVNIGRSRRIVASDLEAFVLGLCNSGGV